MKRKFYEENCSRDSDLTIPSFLQKGPRAAQSSSSDLGGTVLGFNLHF